MPDCARATELTSQGVEGGGGPSVPSSPHVMLSPKATKRVADSVGGGVTVTANPHELVRCSASVATQATAVVPIGKEEPLAGVHVVVTGAFPLVTTGAA